MFILVLSLLLIFDLACASFGCAPGSQFKKKPGGNFVVQVNKKRYELNKLSEFSRH